jgi:hypothetical protein
VPIITDPSPRYFIALLFIGIGIAVYVPLVYYRHRPQWMGESFLSPPIKYYGDGSEINAYMY